MPLPPRPHDAVLDRLRKLHPQLIDLSLDRMQRMMTALGHPERKLPPVVHVAGTNGKGSTVAFVRAIAEAAGLKVHAFTSPHLVRWTERIRLAGELISEERLTEILERLEAVNAGQPITEFEITTVAAIQAMSETPADLAVIEVGLGGRYDATNVFDRPAVSVITPVDYDHKEFLGDTLTKIAGEKAGIIKAGRPVVVARQEEEALKVIEAEAERLGAPLILAGRDFDGWGEGDGMAYQAGDVLLDLPRPSLHGAHQVDNAGVAIAAVRALEDPRFDPEAIALGVAGASWPGRMQRLTAGPLGEMAAARGADLWLDGSHNPHGARALARTAERLRARDGRPLTLVVGILARKDAAGMFAGFAEAKPERVFTVGFPYHLAADPEALASAARAAGLRAEPCPDVSEGLRRALSVDGPPPHVIICGALYLAGEVLALSPETWPR